MSANIWKYRRSKSRFRAAYTRSGLAELFNMPKTQVRHLLGKLPNLVARRIGNRDYYYLADLRALAPDLFESIRLKRELDTEDTQEEATTRAFSRTA